MKDKYFFIVYILLCIMLYIFYIKDIIYSKDIDIILYDKDNKIITKKIIPDRQDYLYLNLNGYDAVRIEGLDKLKNLNAFSLRENSIQKIENLDQLSNLVYLDLDSNKITKIEGLSKLKNLKNLSLQNNMIGKVENLENLKSLETLSIYDNLLTKQEYELAKKRYPWIEFGSW